MSSHDANQLVVHLFHLASCAHIVVRAVALGRHVTRLHAEARGA